MNTGDIGQLSQPGGPLYNIEHSNGGLITFPGGVPIKDGDTVIGANGVSGSTVENDHTVAAAGAAAVWQRLFRPPGQARHTVARSRTGAAAEEASTGCLGVLRSP